MEKGTKSGNVNYLYGMRIRSQIIIVRSAILIVFLSFVCSLINIHPSASNGLFVGSIQGSIQRSIQGSDDPSSYYRSFNAVLNVEKSMKPTSVDRTMLAYPTESWKPDLNDWILQDLGLKVFVYDKATWPNEIGKVHECRLLQYGNESEPADTVNDNRIGDIGIIQLFQTYPGRVYDPKQADVFVVPYPHASHCFSDKCRSGPYQPNCGGVPQSLIDDLVDRQLTYFQGLDIDRHLFILSASHMLNRKLQMAALKFVIGGRIYKLDKQSQNYLPRMNPRFKSNPKQLGNFIIPYLNSHPWLQPKIIRSRPLEWWTRPRKYSFSFVFGTRNRKTTADPRIYRRQFQNYLNKTADGTLGGLPYSLISNPKGLTPEAMLELYQDSTFCPCLPGDTVTQKRFFDVILSGCLPVVLQFRHKNFISWHPFDNSNLNNTVPFAHPQQYGPNLLVNYSTFVVQSDSPKAITQTMLNILKNPEDLKQRQVAMSHVAPLLTFGLGPDNAHRYDDAFARLLRGLKHYLDTRLPPRTM